MGLFDFFKLGKVVLGTISAVKDQRALARELAMLPTAQFADECLRCLNMSAGHWEGRLRTPNPDATSLAQAMRLPDDLAAFYQRCNGFDALRGELPAAVVPIEGLTRGRDFTPTLADRLAAYWAEHGNDSEASGQLSVLPPDDLAALATHAADRHVELSVLDDAVALVTPRGQDVVVLLLADAGPRLPRGTVLDIEGGSATRYQSFTAWLASSASLFGSFGGGSSGAS